MGQQQQFKKSKQPILAPVLEGHAATDSSWLDKRQQSVRYKPHKYGSESSQQCTSCLSVRFSFLGRLRDRYIKAMNEMAMGGDFTAVTGYHGWGLEHGYNLANDRQLDAALQPEQSAVTKSRSLERQSQQL